MLKGYEYKLNPHRCSAGTLPSTSSGKNWGCGTKGHRETLRHINNVIIKSYDKLFPAESEIRGGSRKAKQIEKKWIKLFFYRSYYYLCSVI